MAAAPVTLGGHGLRAFVLELLGRRAEAAADGAAFMAEAIEVHRSWQARREVERRYTSAAAQLLAMYGAACDELLSACPGAEPWRGEPLDGATVALRVIEGFGDQIQAPRLARAVRAAGGRVLVGCDDPLVDLVRHSGLADGFLDRPARAAGERVDRFVVAGGRLHERGIDPPLWTSAPYLHAPEDDAEPARSPTCRRRAWACCGPAARRSRWR